MENWNNENYLEKLNRTRPKIVCQKFRRLKLLLVGSQQNRIRNTCCE